jgi:hypothetical protein
VAGFSAVSRAQGRDHSSRRFVDCSSKYKVGPTHALTIRESNEIYWQELARFVAKLEFGSECLAALNRLAAKSIRLRVVDWSKIAELSGGESRPLYDSSHGS